MIRCMVVRGADPEHTCMGCGHYTGSHLFPSGICMECIEHDLLRLDMQEELHVRVDRLAFAVQTLTERLDAGRIEELERRIGEFTSRWPRREGPQGAQR